MKCKACQNDEMKYKEVSVPFFNNNRLILIKNVYAYECDVCGERIFDKTTTGNILKKIKESTDNFIKVPVFSF